MPPFLNKMIHVNTGKAEILHDEELIKYIQQNKRRAGKLSIVKYVWSHSEKRLKEAKEFVDENM